MEIHLLIVDDEGMSHLITEMALKHFTFKDCTLIPHSAYSAAEAMKFLNEFDGNVAIVLLDIVMETLTAGLDMIPYINTTVAGRNARIILRTGQAGRAARSDIVRDYPIHGYHDKATLDHDTLLDTIILAIRNYYDIIRNPYCKSKQ